MKWIVIISLACLLILSGCTTDTPRYTPDRAAHIAWDTYYRSYPYLETARCVPEYLGQGEWEVEIYCGDYLWKTVRLQETVFTTTPTQKTPSPSSPSRSPGDIVEEDNNEMIEAQIDFLLEQAKMWESQASRLSQHPLANIYPAHFAQQEAEEYKFVQGSDHLELVAECDRIQGEIRYASSQAWECRQKARQLQSQLR